MTYINIEYFFYKIFLLTKQSYFFVINIPWPKVVFWGQIISGIIVALFAIGIVYNLIGISRAKQKD